MIKMFVVRCFHVASVHLELRGILQTQLCFPGCFVHFSDKGLRQVPIIRHNLPSMKPVSPAAGI